MGWEQKLLGELHDILLVQKEKAGEKISGFLDNTVDYSPTEGDSKAGYATGEFLNNWKVDNVVTSGYTKTPNPSRSERKQELRKELDEALKTFSEDKSIYLFNNSPYAFKVEYLGWGKTSAYAPLVRAISEFD